jgi:hypothetical protein
MVTPTSGAVRGSGPGAQDGCLNADPEVHGVLIGEGVPAPGRGASIHAWVANLA